MQKELNDIILRFFLEDVGGILITDAEGRALYEDEKVRSVRSERTNWSSACPSPREGQRGERWDLLDRDSGKTYMVVTSTCRLEGWTLQLHHLADSSEYTELFRDLGSYSGNLMQEKDHDSLTGLYNKGKFLSLRSYLFREQDSLAVFCMDLNNLKHTNDQFGHEAGDALIRKAAESLKRIEAQNVIPFRVGGDEFLVVALQLSREEALKLRETWEKGLAELNRADDGLDCEIACGFAFGEKGYDLAELLAEADRRMYKDKRAKKAADR